jgi:hypothetical protein
MDVYPERIHTATVPIDPLALAVTRLSNPVTPRPITYRLEDLTKYVCPP